MYLKVAKYTFLYPDADLSHPVLPLLTLLFGSNLKGAAPGGYSTMHNVSAVHNAFAEPL